MRIIFTILSLIQASLAISQVNERNEVSFQEILLGNAGESRRKLSSEKDSKEVIRVKPVMYTYIDVNSMKQVNLDFLEIWKESWTNAGFQVQILDLSHAERHPNYKDYARRLDEANLCCLSRQTFLRFIAMSTIPIGAFYSEHYAFPLHKNHHKEIKLPSKGKMTFYDRFAASLISASQPEWQLLTDRLMNTLAENSFQSLLLIAKKHPGAFLNLMAVLNENIKFFNRDICKDVQQKVFVRLHGSDITKLGLSPDKQPAEVASFMKNWFSFYAGLCWNVNAHVAPKEIKTYNAGTNVNSSTNSVLELPPEKKTLFEDSTISTVHCPNDGISCRVQNACIGQNGVLKLFGNTTYVQKQRAKLEQVLLHAWVCTDCRRKVPTERATGNHVVWGKTATLSAGLSLNNCGHHIGDVIWPLIRLHMKFRTTTELVEGGGLGHLFLESPTSPCDSIYNAVAEQVTRYHSITEDICFDNVYFGAHMMNFMTSSPNAIFIPYDNFNRDMKAMRRVFYHSYGVHPQNVEMDSILIMYKKKGLGNLRSLQYHNIANIAEITQMIQEQFSQYQVHIVSWDDYNVASQVRLMARTKLMIALPGSAIMNAFLFQNQAALLCYCQKGRRPDSGSKILNGVLFQGSNEYKLWFDHFKYGKFFEICSNKDMNLLGEDVIINVERLQQRMHALGM